MGSSRRSGIERGKPDPNLVAALTNIRTAEDLVVAFRDEEQCRRLLESMMWPVASSLR